MMIRHPARDAVRLARQGFTLVEALIAMTVGVIVLSAAVGFLLAQMRTLGSGDIREDLSRNSRYLGVSLRHDVQAAGIEITSTTSFGTVAAYPGTYGDTLVILHVPYVPSPAPPHDIDPPAGTDNPLAAGGTCGTYCIDVIKDANEPLELRQGDLARLQVAGTRRLILVENISTTNDTSIAITFTAHDTILRQPAGLASGLRLDRFSTYVQKVQPTMYYLDDQQRLWRAVRLNLSGSPAGDILAYGVEQFDVTLIFSDGDELDRADPNDSDNSNDYDDIVAIRVRATFAADRVDPRVNQGKVLKSTHEWLISPRNLRYEKNKI
ncbi:MAG: prepilin-type N-terminal cleavage/methylation domain-containing protein [Gemmatimonadota bacterium]